MCIAKMLLCTGRASEHLSLTDKAIAVYSDIYEKFNTTSANDGGLRDSLQLRFWEKQTLLKGRPEEIDVYDQLVNNRENMSGHQLLRTTREIGFQPFTTIDILLLKSTALYSIRRFDEMISVLQREILPRIEWRSDHESRRLTLQTISDKAFALSASKRIEEALAVLDSFEGLFRQETDSDLLIEIVRGLHQKAQLHAEQKQLPAATAILDTLTKRIVDPADESLRDCMQQTIKAIEALLGGQQLTGLHDLPLITSSSRSGSEADVSSSPNLKSHCFS